MLAWKGGEKQLTKGISLRLGDDGELRRDSEHVQICVNIIADKIFRQRFHSNWPAERHI
jgi:hypothetical protein